MSKIVGLPLRMQTAISTLNCGPATCQPSQTDRQTEWSVQMIWSRVASTFKELLLRNICQQLSSSLISATGASD